MSAMQGLFAVVTRDTVRAKPHVARTPALSPEERNARPFMNLLPPRTIVSSDPPPRELP